jgi:hypothetical protein
MPLSYRADLRPPCLEKGLPSSWIHVNKDMSKTGKSRSASPIGISSLYKEEIYVQKEKQSVI